MNEISWGLLGPESVVGERRTRTLNLGASVRLFNDLAVPGLGGVWYAKQLLLPTLGVGLAQRAKESGLRVTNIETANAIEALACLLAFESIKWRRDNRLRGNTKLHGKVGDVLPFSRARQPGFYVTQPMRMASVQPLPALGLVEAQGIRFNAFGRSAAGDDFVDAATARWRPNNRDLVSQLLAWVHGTESRVMGKTVAAALSPTVAMEDDARRLLRERLVHDSATDGVAEPGRRRNALAWVESLRVTGASREPVAWARRPAGIEAPHWHDLQCGALFFGARDAAIGLLDALEAWIGNRTDVQKLDLPAPMPAALEGAHQQLRDAAGAYLAAGHADAEAQAFCRECTQPALRDVLAALVRRDGRVLRLAGDAVVPGPAFRGKAAVIDGVDDEPPAADASATGTAPRMPEFPAGISPRIANLYLLNADLHGQLEPLLAQAPVAQGEDA